MARPLRIEYPGALYHVTARGNARAAIYLDDADRAGFLQRLAAVTAHRGWRLHAYCLMDNHYHLVVETPDADLSRGMRQINGTHTQDFNRRHGRVGHVLQGRYKAILVDRDAYLLELARYVVLNPARAGMVERPGDWSWSSYRAVAGEAAAPAWLETDWVLAQFGARRKRAQAAWRAFVADGIGVDLWGELRQQIYLGDDEFVAAAQARTSAGSSGAPRVQRRAPAPPLNAFAAHDGPRDSAIVAAWRSGAYTQAEIGRAFGLGHSRVSKIVTAAELEEKIET